MFHPSLHFWRAFLGASKSWHFDPAMGSYLAFSSKQTNRNFFNQNLSNVKARETAIPYLRLKPETLWQALALLGPRLGFSAIDGLNKDARVINPSASFPDGMIRNAPAH